MEIRNDVNAACTKENKLRGNGYKKLALWISQKRYRSTPTRVVLIVSVVVGSGVADAGVGEQSHVRQHCGSAVAGSENTGILNHAAGRENVKQFFYFVYSTTIQLL